MSKRSENQHNCHRQRPTIDQAAVPYCFSMIITVLLINHIQLG